MGRLTSASNNHALPPSSVAAAAVHLPGSSSSTSAMLTAGIIGLLLRHASAVPMPPARELRDMGQHGAHHTYALRRDAALPTVPGCCVSYSVSYDHSECCHEFEAMEGEHSCRVPRGFVGGGKRYHSSSCDVARQLARYAPAQGETAEAVDYVATDETVAESSLVGGPISLGPAWTHGETEAPRGTRHLEGYTISVYTSEQQARLGVDEGGAPVPAATDGKAIKDGAQDENHILIGEPRNAEIPSDDENHILPGDKNFILSDADDNHILLGDENQNHILSGDKDHIWSDITMMLPGVLPPGVLPVIFDGDKPKPKPHHGEEEHAKPNDNHILSGQPVDDYELTLGAGGRTERGGCCVSYGLGSGMTEVNHAFVDIPAALPPTSFAIVADSAAEKCATPAGWTGGGERFHEGMSCDETRSLSQYQKDPPSSVPVPTEAPMAEEYMGGWVAAVFSTGQQARLHVDKWGKRTDNTRRAKP